jgi:release factor glutamine methyltransferase
MGPPLAEVLDSAATRLREAGVENPFAEAQLLTGQVLRLERATLLAHPEYRVGEIELARIEARLERRVKREPFAYVVGEREFYGRTFLTDRRALVPRPETELLIETALNTLRQVVGRPLIVDVGTGTGCIAVTLALELPTARVLATDLSAEALALAAINVERFNVTDRVQLLRGNLLSWLQGPVDLVAANLPYVPSEAFGELAPEVRDYEPRLALDGGPGGARLIERLIGEAAQRRIGVLLAELDSRHAERVLSMARKAWPGRPAEILADLAGRPRLLRVVGDR